MSGSPHQEKRRDLRRGEGVVSPQCCYSDVLGVGLSLSWQHCPIFSGVVSSDFPLIIDFTAGMHTGWINVVKNGRVRLSLIWDDPHGGRGYDEFRLVAENELQVVSQIEVGDKTAGYTIVYRRKQ